MKRIHEISFGRKTQTVSNFRWMVLIGLFAFLLRLFFAAFYRNGFDLNPYNIPWALGTEEGVFSIYKNVENLDYPPLFPFLLSLVAKGVAYGKDTGIWQLEMLFIKLIPVLFDVGIVLLFYLIGGKRSLKAGVLLSSLWAMNISSIFNCSFWGQTDSLLLFFLLLIFWLFWEKKPLPACICFALGCLSKLQMAYFTPVLLLELILHYPVKQWAKSLFSGIAVGIAGWLPFMIGSGEWALSLRIYFGGFGKYSYVNVNAFNLYGLSDLNWVTDQLSLFGGTVNEEGVVTGGFTYSLLSLVFLILLLLVVVGCYFTARWSGKEIPGAFHALFLINGIFMLTTKMHERYQIPVLVLSLLCFALEEKRIFFYFYLLFTGITFWNQSAVLLRANFGGIFSEVFRTSQFWGSLCNGALFLGLLICYVVTVFGKDFFVKKKVNFPQHD